MGELIAHLIGDFCLQSQVIALKKTRSWSWAALHVALYLSAFLCLTRAPAALAVIAGTHLVIDRYRLARCWTQFWGVGCEGRVAAYLRRHRRRRYVETYRHIRRDADAAAEFDAAHPPLPPAPEYLAVWLLILVDNSAHLLINHLAIAYL